MKRLLYILFTFILINSCKQKPKEIRTILTIPHDVTINDSGFQQTEFFNTAEEMPQFGNGMEDVVAYFQENIQYPASAIRDSIQGKVFTFFVIEENGVVSNPSIYRGVRSDIDNECLRAIQIMPKWKPCKQGGRPVRCRYSILFSFILSGNLKTNGIIIKPKSPNLQELDFKIYPNPAHDFLNINIEDNYTQVRYQIVNSSGQIVSNGQLNESIEQIDISKLTNGIYYLNLTSTDKRRSKVEKFIKN